MSGISRSKTGYSQFIKALTYRSQFSKIALENRLVHERIGSLATLLFASELEGKTLGIGIRLKMPLQSLTQRILELAKDDLGHHHQNQFPPSDMTILKHRNGT